MAKAGRRAALIWNWPAITWDRACGPKPSTCSSGRSATSVPFASTYPLVHYCLGYLHEQAGEREAASKCYAAAAGMPSDYCFPFRGEELAALRAALVAQPEDARARYYLGNLLYELQPDEAIAAWEESRGQDGSLATVHRNLGWAYYRQRNDLARAIDSYEKAIACDQRDPRLFVELDTLYEFSNVTPARRLATLAPHHAVLAQRQDSLLREIIVLVLNGQYDPAIALLTNNRFHAKEGSEGIHDVYVDAHLLRGLEHLQADAVRTGARAFRAGGPVPGEPLGRQTPERPAGGPDRLPDGRWLKRNWTAPKSRRRSIRRSSSRPEPTTGPKPNSIRPSAGSNSVKKTRQP